MIKSHVWHTHKLWVFPSDVKTWVPRRSSLVFKISLIKIRKNIKKIPCVLMKVQERNWISHQFFFTHEAREMGKSQTNISIHISGRAKVKTLQILQLGWVTWDKLVDTKTFNNHGAPRKLKKILITIIGHPESYATDLMVDLNSRTPFERHSLFVKRTFSA